MSAPRPSSRLAVTLPGLRVCPPSPLEEEWEAAFAAVSVAQAALKEAARVEREARARLARAGEALARRGGR